MSFDDEGLVSGVLVTELKKIEHPQGDILHAMKSSSTGFHGFGEAYFSTIHRAEIKGWKKHSRMTLNLIVPIGEVQFVIYDDREMSQTKGKLFVVLLSRDNYKRLTVPPGLWVAFQGKSDGANVILNVADIEHDPREAINAPLSAIDFNWSVDVKN